MPFDTITEPPRHVVTDQLTRGEAPLCKAEVNGLYGDYNAIIDQALGGDPSIKDAVARADTEGRRGLQSLKYYLNKHKAVLSSESERLLAICEADQEYYEQRQQDFQHIELRPNGKYRVTVQSLGVRHRQVFDTLSEAQDWRDRMLCFFASEAINL